MFCLILWVSLCPCAGCSRDHPAIRPGWVGQQGGTSPCVQLQPDSPHSSSCGSSLDSCAGIWPWQLQRVIGPSAEWSWWMNVRAARVTCKGTKSDKETTQFRQMLLISNFQTCLWHEGCHLPLERRGWEALFLILSLSRSQGFKAQAPASFSQPLFLPYSHSLCCFVFFFFFSGALLSWHVPHPLACTILRVWAVRVRWLPVSVSFAAFFF